MKFAAVVLCVLVGPMAAVAQPRKVDTPWTEQTIGSWVLSCAVDPMTDAQVCRMRDRVWLVVPGDNHPGLALEVLQKSDQLVPVLAVRDITWSTALGGLLTLTATAQVRFDSNPMIELPCALDGATVICAPVKADAAASAEQLAKAHTVLVRLRPVGNLPLPVPDGPVAVDLDRTPEALARYRLAGPTVETAQPWLGQDLKDMAERLLRRVGVPGMEPQAPVK
jgi:hypothetical protein